MKRRDALVLAGAAAAGAVGVRAEPLEKAQLRAPMLKRTIPSTKEELPIIGLGTWQTFDVDVQSAAATAPLAEVMRTLVDEGGSVIDSSPMYGQSENVAGALLEQLKLREKLFVATKVWTRGKSEGIAQMEESLRLLRCPLGGGATPCDLMQVHNLVDHKTHLATLSSWKASGRVRYVGITHYTASAHDEVARVLQSERGRIDFVQINYSVAERDADKTLLPLAQELGVAVIANRPFAGGEIFARVRAKPLPEWAKEIGCTSWAQLLLKFVVGHPAVTCAIPATSKEKHLRDNAGAGRGPMPDAAMRERIVQAALAT